MDKNFYFQFFGWQMHFPVSLRTSMVGYRSSEGLGRGFILCYFVIFFIQTVSLKYSSKMRGYQNKGVDFEMGDGTPLHVIGRQGTMQNRFAFLMFFVDKVAFESSLDLCFHVLIVGFFS